MERCNARCLASQLRGCVTVSYRQFGIFLGSFGELQINAVRVGALGFGQRVGARAVFQCYWNAR